MGEIPTELVINWDQTGIHYVPVSSLTMAKVGSNWVQIAGSDDKRQITTVFGVTMAGDCLPTQLNSQGKTSKCLFCVSFSPIWHITFTENHWSNEKAMVDYLEKILFPYIERKRHEIKVHLDFPALVVFDQFQGQWTEKILPCLKLAMSFLLFPLTAQTDSNQWTLA